MPERIKVSGSLFKPVVPDGAVYVGRSGPGLAASKYANPFALNRKVWRHQPLRPYLWAAILDLATDGDSVMGDGPDVITPGTAAVAVAAYARWFVCQPHLMAVVRSDLAGRDIACWCRLPVSDGPDLCHGRWLMDLVNEETPDA
jgi:Domain of unknown function (DUF4326)